jgi:alanine racemase
MNCRKDLSMVIDTKAINHNIRYLQEKSKTDIMAVLKGNAYGHGLISMAKIVRKAGIKHIGVATIEEAINLRKSGDKGRILTWLYSIDCPELVEALHLDIDIALFDQTQIEHLIQKIPKSKKARVTLFVDTGFNRTGVPYQKAIQTAITLSSSDKIKFVGIMSHLVDSEKKNSPIVHQQLRLFRALRDTLDTMGICPPLVHIANTGGCINYDVSDFSFSRIGSGLYGIANEYSPHKGLHLATSLLSRVVQKKEIKKGEGVGYEWKYIAKRNTSISILPIGYIDVFSKNTSNLHVYINGSKRKQLGMIGMDQMVVEGKEEDRINDVVCLFGNGMKCPQTIFDISKMCQLTPIELLCHLGKFVHRIYL